MAPKLRKRDLNETKSPKKDGKKEKKKEEDSPKKELSPPPKSDDDYKIPWKKIIARICLSVGIMLLVFFTNKDKEEEFKSMALHKDRIDDRAFEVPCSKDYKKELAKYPGCTPKVCGRMVSDILLTPKETNHLLEIAKKGIAMGGSKGGASILDLHSGALSQGANFVNVYKLIKSTQRVDLFTDEDFKVYKVVKEKIQQMVAYKFGLTPNLIYLTHPTFFSKLTDRPARTVHDEYWHVHVDKETYPSFHYTSLVYLSDYGIDFTGGRFVFVDPKLNITVEPKMGRVAIFTSGSENPHYVEKVASGTRYALTVSFTCNKAEAIKDPSLSGAPKKKKI